ncbi:MAG: hypothetical protein RRX93_08395, partial [Bacteroidales bacterium]
YTNQSSYTNNSNGLFNNLPRGYYTVKVEDAKGCVSIPKEVVLNDPNAPQGLIIKGGGKYCINSSMPVTLEIDTLRTKPEGTVSWYTDYDLSNTSLVTHATKITIPIATGIYTYYVVQEKNACRSTPTKVEVIISEPAIIDSVKYTDPTTCYLSDGNIQVYAHSSTYDKKKLLYTIDGFAQYKNNTGDFFGLGSAEYSILVNDPAGCSTVGPNIVLEAPDIPPTPVMNSRDTTMCPEERIELSATPISGGRIEWYSNKALTSHYGSGNIIAIQNLSSGTYYFTAVEYVDNVCHSLGVSVKVKVFPAPEVGFSSDTTVCVGSSITLKVNAGPGSNYLWSTGETSSSITVLATSQISTYTVKIINAYSCRVSKSVNVATVLPDTLKANILSNFDTYCEDDLSRVLSLNVFGTAHINNIEWYNGSNIYDIGNYSVDVSNLPAGRYSFRAYVSSNSACTTPTSLTTNPYNFIVHAKPHVEAGSDESIAYGTTTAFTGIATSVNEIDSIYWTPTDRINGNFATNTVATMRLFLPTWFTFNAIDTLGCTAEDVKLVNITGGPLNVQCLPIPEAICIGDSVALTAVSSGGSGHYTYHWTSDVSASISGLTPINDTLSTGLKVAPKANTVYTISVSDSFATVYCKIIVKVDSLSLKGTLSVNPDTICYGGSAQINLKNYRANSIQWSVSEDGVIYTLAGSEFDNKKYCQSSNQKTNLWYRAKVKNGACPAVITDSVEVMVQKEITNDSIWIASDSLCSNSNTVVLGGSIPQGAFGNFTYKWQMQGENGLYVDAPGVNNQQNYTYPNTLAHSAWFQRITNSISSSSATCTHTSNSAREYIYEPADAGQIVGDTTTCYNFTAGVELSQYVATTFTWLYSMDQVNWTTLVNEKTNHIRTSKITEPTYFRAIVRNGIYCPADTSSILKVDTTSPHDIKLSINKTDTIICATSPLTVSVKVEGAGRNPLYQWYNKGIAINGAVSSAYTTTDQADGDYYYCVVTSSDSCVNDIIVSSDTLRVRVPFIPLSVTPDLEICRGDTICLGANGAKTYEWFNSQNSTTYNGDSICLPIYDTTYFTLTAIDSNACKAYDTVSIYPQPFLHIIASDTVTCENVNFDLSAKIGSIIGAYFTWTSTDTAFVTQSVSSIHVKADTTATYKVQVITPLGCIASDSIEIKVEKYATPTVDITYDGHYDSINNIVDVIECEGKTNYFRAIGSNGGEHPIYHWYVSGEKSKIITDSFPDQGLLHNARVYASLTSSLLCVTDTTVRTKSLIIRFTPKPTAGISIESNKGQRICEGTKTTFFSAWACGGSMPEFIWKSSRLGVVGKDSLYTTTDLQDGDVIQCIMIATDSCVKNHIIASNPIRMTVIGNVKPKVFMHISPSGSVCEYSDVVFSASAQEPGSAPTYTWYKDGMEIGQGSTITYYGNQLLNMDGDAFSAVSNTELGKYNISVKMNTTHECAVPSTLVSFDSILLVRPREVVDVNIEMEPDPILCNTIIETPAEWEYISGANVSTGQIGGGNHYWWDNGAISRQRIWDNGSVSATINTNISYSMFGLSAKNPSSVDYTTIEYALYNNYGSLAIYESGEYIGSFGSYAIGDRCKVEVADSVVYYLKNDKVFYVSKKKATQYPLFADFSLYRYWWWWYDDAGYTNVKVEHRATFVKFIAHPVNEGDNPIYQWFVNGERDGKNDSIFTNSYRLFKAGDTVYSKVKSSYDCVYEPEVESNRILLVHPNGKGHLKITAPDTSVCYGSCIQLEATGSASYEWSPIFIDAQDTTYSYHWTYIYDTLNPHIDSNYVSVVDTVTDPNFDISTLNPLDSVWNYFEAGTIFIKDSVRDSVPVIKQIQIPETAPNPVVCPADLTYYKVIGANANGCTDFKRVKVTVLPLPDPEVGPDYEICKGDSVVLTANYKRRPQEGYSYIWTSSDGVFHAIGDTVHCAPDTTRTYYVKMTGGNTCSASDTLTITVNYLPQVY